MQKVIAGVSGMNTASMRRWSASSSTNFRVPSIDGSSRHQVGVTDLEVSGETSTQILREVGHLLEVDDPAFVNPAVELPRVKALAPARLERASSSGNIQLGQVEMCSTHAMSRIS